MTHKPTILHHKWIKDDRYGLPICRYCGHVLRRDNGNRDNECPGQVRAALRGTCSKCGKPRLDCRCHFGTVAMQNATAEGSTPPKCVECGGFMAMDEEWGRLRCGKCGELDWPDEPEACP